jgi:hypothetical protein
LIAYSRYPTPSLLLLPCVSLLVRPANAATHNLMYQHIHIWLQLCVSKPPLLSVLPLLLLLLLCLAALLQIAGCC